MLHKWEFSDGTVARWTNTGSLLIDGQSELAKALAHRTRLPPHRPGWSVYIHPFSGGSVPLDLSSVWLVNLFFEQEAERCRASVVSSTYTAKDEDAPPNAAELLAMTFSKEDLDGTTYL